MTQTPDLNKLYARLDELENENRVLKVRLDAKKKKVLKDRGAEKRVQLAHFIKLVARGKDRDEIMATLDMGEVAFDSMFARYYEEAELEQGAQSPLRRFVDYVIRQNALTRDLENLKSALGLKRNGQAYVQAVKTQSEILDKLIKTGQELGLIQKAADTLMFVGGKDAREVGAEELEQEVQRSLEEIQKMVGMKAAKGKKKAKIIQFSSQSEQRDSIIEDDGSSAIHK